MPQKSAKRGGIFVETHSGYPPFQALHRHLFPGADGFKNPLSTQFLSQHIAGLQEADEQCSKPLLPFYLCWLVNRDPYNGLL